MNAVLAILSGYKTINAVCLMMKSNEARLTTNLRHCLSELLLRLHRDAAENICFFFTNCRGTFYKPGDSLATLDVFTQKVKAKSGVELKLTQDNVFCLDNEAYRLVCAIQKGAKFGEEQKKLFEASWTHSNGEVLRFLDYAHSRPQHSVKKTLNLNQARRLVLLLAKPMAEIAQMNQDNITLSQRHHDEVEQTEADISKLLKKIKIPQESFEIENLSYPRTVCTGPNCVETQRVSNSNSLQTLYTQTCHDHCYLKGVTREKFPDPALRNCRALRVKGKCKVCKCNWSLHMHLTYIQKKVMILVDDPAIANVVGKMQNAKELKEGILEHLSRRYEDMEQEQSYIRQCSVYFAAFLKKSAILPYNDVFEEQAKRIIEEEKRLVAQGADPKTLHALEKAIKEYAEERQVIDASFAASNDKDATTIENMTENIHSIFKELFKLKFTGEQFQKLFEEVTQGEKVHERANVIQIASRWSENESEEADQSKTVSSSKPHVAPKISPSTGQQVKITGRYGGSY